MKKTPTKRDFPLEEIRQHLEPGPILLVSSEWKGKRNIMTLGWHMMLQFSPSLVATYIWEGNTSYNMIRQSKECVLNIPTAELIDAVVGIGNSSGVEEDKFTKYGLTAQPSKKLKGAPLIKECHANFECVLVDSSMVKKYGLFIWEVVKAHVAPSPKQPQTLHYRGQGEFMLPGGTISRKKQFKEQNL